MTQLSIRRATGYVVTAAAAWGTGGAAGSLLFAAGGFDALDVTFWRFLLGAAFLLPLLGGASWRLDRHVLVVGAGMAVYQAAYFAAIARSGGRGGHRDHHGRDARVHRPRRASSPRRAARPVRPRRTPGRPDGTRPPDGGLPGGAGRLRGGGALGGAGFALLSAFGYAGVTLLSRRLGTAEEPGDPLATAAAGFLVGGPRACCRSRWSAGCCPG
ncbi:hypothetical protein ACFSTC_08185 [Nonomuraea ferruginea]